MKKIIAVSFVLLLLPVASMAKTFNISFFSDDSNFDGVATLQYKLCTSAPQQPIQCSKSHEFLNFHAETGENTAQITGISNSQYVIAYELSTGHKKPLYINTPADIDQPCKAVNDGDTLTIQPSTAGLYACNGEMTHL